MKKIKKRREKELYLGKLEKVMFVMKKLNHNLEINRS